MYSILLFFISLFCFSGSLNGQASVNELVQQWKDSTQEEPTRLKALQELSKYYLYLKPDSSLFYANQIIQYPDSNRAKNYQSIAHHIKGIAFANLGKNEQSLAQFQRALRIAYSKKDTLQVVNSLTGIGVLNKNEGKLSAALDKHFEAFKFVLKSPQKYRRQKASCLVNIGNIFMDISDMPRAKEYFEKALLLCDDNSPKNLLASIHNNLGLIERELDRLRPSLSYFSLANQLFSSCDNIEGVSITYNNLGKSYRILQKLDSAFYYYQKSLLLAYQMNSRKQLASTFIYLSDYYFEVQQLDSARIIGERALKLSKSIGRVDFVKNGSELLHRIYKATHNNELALNMHELFIQSKDSLIRYENQRSIIRKEFKHNFDRDLVAQKKASQQKQFLEKAILTLIFAAVVFLVLVMYYLQRKKHHEKTADMLQKIEQLKENSVLTLANSTAKIDNIVIDKNNIEKAIESKLNTTDWKVLYQILNKPSVTNKEIAKAISLSYEGTSSSLRKMYKLFDIKVKKNHKLALILKASELSNQTKNKNSQK